jgi:hypothetical protein
MVPRTSLVRDDHRHGSGYDNSSIRVQCDIWGSHSGITERHVSWDVTAQLGLRHINVDDPFLKTAWLLTGSSCINETHSVAVVLKHFTGLQ